MSYPEIDAAESARASRHRCGCGHLASAHKGRDEGRCSDGTCSCCDTPAMVRNDARLRGAA